MKKKLLVVSLLIILLTGLSTSSFFLNEYLTKVITENEHSEAQLSFAIKLENLTALDYAWKHSEFHSEQWLTLARTLAKTRGEAAYQLAVYYQDTPNTKVFWLRNASKLSYHQARLTLAQHFFDQDNYIKAAEILSTIPSDQFDSSTGSEKLRIAVRILAVNIAINQGQITHVEQILTQDSQLLKSAAVGQLLLNDIRKYNVVLSGKPTNGFSQLTLHCDNSIQLFATSLAHLKQVERIVEDFKTQPLNNSVCFAPVRYMPIKALDCSEEQNTVIRCDEVKWQLFASSINTRYVGIMLPKGGANVHLGLLYFDSQDSVDVVAHEISHLLGFVDEYPLKAKHIACQIPQEEVFSQNIAVLKNSYQGDKKTIRASVLKQLAWAKYIKSSTPILQAAISLDDKFYWQLGTPDEFKHEIGLFKAKTCNNASTRINNDFGAYKGVAQHTQLEYFSLKFPQFYTRLLQDNPIDYRMPSFHYNIALAYFQQTLLQPNAPQQFSSYKNNIKQANYWLEQAAKWEDDLTRHKKIRQGSF